MTAKPLAACVLLLSLAASACAQAPLEYETLDIVYRFGAGPTLYETRTGELKVNVTDLPGPWRRLVIPRLNAAGTVHLEQFSLVRSGGSAATGGALEWQRTADALFWDIPEAQAGDRIRFTVTQPVDLVRQGGAWWYAESAMIPIPVQRGSIALQLPEGFAGSVDTLAPATRTPAGFLWPLANASATSETRHFTVSSFITWGELGAWVARHCPAEPTAEVRTLAAGVATPAANTGDRAALIAAALATRLDVLPFEEGGVMRACRPPGEVLRSGQATPLEAQALLASALEAAKVPAERFLSGVAAKRDRTPDPAVFSRTLIRVRDGARPVWFDAERLAEVGLSSDPALVAAALSIREAGAEWHAPGADAAQTRIDRITTRLDVALAPTGLMQADLLLRAEGDASSPLRKAFQAGPERPGFNQFLGAFLRNMRLRSGPVVTDPQDLRHPFEVHIPVRQEDFLLPFQRQLKLQPSVLTMSLGRVALPDGQVLLSAPENAHEEITIELPPRFSTDAALNSDIDRPFARYRSEANVVDGKLIVTRTLQIKTLLTSVNSKELDDFEQEIRADQERVIDVRRSGPANVATWLASVPLHIAGDYGNRAIREGESAVAKELFRLALKYNPKEAYALGGLGRAQLGLWELAEARASFERQLELSPDDGYARYGIAIAWNREGRPDRAVERLREQVKIKPDWTLALDTLTTTLLDLGNWAEAEEYANRAAKTAPRNPSYYLNVLLARVCQVKTPDATSELEGLLAGAPPSPLRAAASRLAECGRRLDLARQLSARAERALPPPEDALTTGNFLETLANQDTRAAALDTYGWVQWKLGNAKEASDALQAAAGFSRRADALSHLAQVRWKLGQKEEAARLWREATRRQPSLLDTVSKELVPALDTSQATTEERPLLRLELPPGFAADTVPPDKPLYYLIVAAADGSVHHARPADAEDETAKALLPEIRRIQFPVVVLESIARPTVHIVRVRRLATGELIAERCMWEDGALIGLMLAPEDIPSAMLDQMGNQ